MRGKVSEYNGEDEHDKTIPIKPRPVRRPSYRLRMTYLTGDPSGRSPRDGGRSWRGEKKRK